MPDSPDRMSDDERDRDRRRRSMSRSRSRSRSRSPRGGKRRDSRSRSPMATDDRGGRSQGGDQEDEYMTVSDEDAAFVLGRGGSTKMKIARVSGARLDLQDKDGRLNIFGTAAARQRAKDYVGYVLTQRTGPVYIDVKTKRDDLSIVSVPEDCVGYVMGRGGVVLRSMEEEWGTLMFFAKTKDSDGNNSEGEILAIFGTRRGRRGAELKVMSAVEHKNPGYFLDGNRLKNKLNQPGDDEGDDFDYDTMPFEGEEFSYALGARGSTRKKLAAAAGCIMEYIGQTAVIAGNARERRQGRDYLGWLLKQRQGNLYVDTAGRDDVTEIEAPRSAIGFVTGHKGEGLRGVESETRTFCFTNSPKDGAEVTGSTETILIFGDDENDRRRAKRIIEDRIDQSQRMDRGERGGGRGRSRDRYDDRRRSPPRYDDRDRGYGGGGGGGYGGGGGRSDICYDFLKGRCFRDRCKFSHDDGGRGRSPPRYDDRRYDDRDRGRYDDGDRGYGGGRDRYDSRDRGGRGRSPPRYDDRRYDDRDRGRY